jgi:hypothetical protein
MAGSGTRNALATVQIAKLCEALLQLSNVPFPAFPEAESVIRFGSREAAASPCQGSEVAQDIVRAANR